MAPTESAILNNYLLTAAQLPAIVTLEQFTALFPRSQQSSPHIRALYRDLQRQRNGLIDSVSANIEAEAKRGKRLRREVVRAKRQEENRDVDDEREVEMAVSCYDSCFLDDIMVLIDLCSCFQPLWEVFLSTHCCRSYQSWRAQHKIWKPSYDLLSLTRPSCSSQSSKRWVI